MPDVVHLVRSVPTIVFDAMYKAADPGGRHANADHYQMLACCTALQLPVGWLVYAGRCAKRYRRIVNTGVTVVESPVDISARPRAVLRRIDELADEAWLRRDRLELPRYEGDMDVQRRERLLDLAGARRFNRS